MSDDKSKDTADKSTSYGVPEAAAGVVAGAAGAGVTAAKTDWKKSVQTAYEHSKANIIKNAEAKFREMPKPDFDSVEVFEANAKAAGEAAGKSFKLKMNLAKEAADKSTFKQAVFFLKNSSIKTKVTLGAVAVGSAALAVLATHAWRDHVAKKADKSESTSRS